jgi:hypothetical protein
VLKALEAPVRQISRTLVSRARSWSARSREQVRDLGFDAQTEECRHGRQGHHRSGVSVPRRRTRPPSRPPGDHRGHGAELPKEPAGADARRRWRHGGMGGMGF